MNRSILEQNLQALDPVDPDLSRRMREIALDGFQAEAIQTKSNALSARLLPQGKEKPVLLHSAYDPVREATRWAESVQVQSPTNIFILGTGLGYHLLTLLKTHAANIRYLFIIERDPRVLKLALSALDLRPIIRLARAKWFVGMEPDLIPDAVGEEGRTDIILHNCQILPHEPSIQCYPEYYNQVRQQLLDAITYDEVNLRTNFENRGRNQFNVFMNLPALFRGYFPKKFENRFQGFPAVVVAAGPSLDKNLHYLEKVNDRAGIIIVDTTQTTFRQKNLSPHTIVTGDPTPLNFSHFEPIDSLGEAFLAFHPEVNRQIPQKFQHH
ncbi:DUF115 domain-containing protein, partial [bacterium]|nr:DUF115 domain-containing protein [bacterium]